MFVPWPIQVAEQKMKDKIFEKQLVLLITKLEKQEISEKEYAQKLIEYLKKSVERTKS